MSKLLFIRCPHEEGGIHTLRVNDKDEHDVDVNNGHLSKETMTACCNKPITLAIKLNRKFVAVRR